MVCSEKLRLVSEFHHATKRLFKAVSELHRGVNKVVEGGYEELLQTVHIALDDAEEARAAVLSHVEEHDC